MPLPKAWFFFRFGAARGADHIVLGFSAAGTFLPSRSQKLSLNAIDLPAAVFTFITSAAPSKQSLGVTDGLAHTVISASPFNEQ